MRRGLLTTVRCGLLAGPVVLAFASGGFFPHARVAAAIGAWLLLAGAALAVPGPLPPRGVPARVALAALAALTGWTALAIGWAPAGGPARDALELALLYLPALAAGVLAWRERPAARWTEPAIAAGALLVIGYGLAGRLLPGVVDLAHAPRAGGRLDQPLTYWNATGTLAAIGLLLCARLAGDRTRPAALRIAAAAAAAPLGMGLYLTFSRGALAAAACGLVVLLLAAPGWPQLRAAAIAVEAAVAGALCAAPFDAVRALAPEHRGVQGAAALVALALVAAGAAALQAWSARAEAAGRAPAGPLPLAPAARGALAAAAAALALAPYVAAVAGERGPAARQAAFGATNARLTDVGSTRARYWDVALGTFADHPLAGAGAGAFGTVWLRERPIDERVRNAHSLWLETLAELGLVGLLLLLAAAGSVAVAARRALHADPALAAGPVAALAAWTVHAGLDWLWQLPAVTLPALTLAAVLLAAPAAPAGTTRR